jgi:hypothetical protein
MSSENGHDSGNGKNGNGNGKPNPPHRWQKGESGNPRGPKTGHTLEKRIAAYAALPDPGNSRQTNHDKIHIVLFREATKDKHPDMFAMKLILERLEPATQKIDHTMLTPEAVNDWTRRLLAVLPEVPHE